MSECRRCRCGVDAVSMCGVVAASVDTGVDRVDVCRSRRVDVGGRINTGNARAVSTGVGVLSVGVSIVSERVERVERVEPV